MPVKSFIVLTLFGVVGCGGPEFGKVNGTITIDGNPVSEGTIMFSTADKPTAVGSINSDGTYTLTSLKPGDGAAIGAHTVTIRCTKIRSERMVPYKDADAAKSRMVLEAGNLEWVVPQKYSQIGTTDLKAVVNPGEQTINFDLSSK